MFDNYLTTFISNNCEVLEKCLGDHVSKKEMKACITLFSSIFVCLQSMSWRSVQVAKRIIKGSWIDQFRNIRLEHQVGEVGLIYSVVCQIDESFSIVDIVRLSNILDQRFKLNNVKELIECVYETPIEMPTINITYKSSYGVSKSDISYNNESKSKEMYSVISEYTLNKENVENKNKSFLNNENGALCNMNIFSIIFEIYSKLVQYVNGSFAKEIVTKLIYEDDNIAIISKEKSLSEIHKTVNFLSLVSTILSFENLSFIRQKFRRLFQIDLFFQKIDACIELIQTEEQKDLEETYYLTSDLSKIFYLLPDLYYQLYFNLNYCECESVQSLDNFFHIFLMNYKSRLESYIDNTNFKEEESIDTQMLKFLCIYMLKMMHQIKKFICNQSFNAENEKIDFRFGCNKITSLIKSLLERIKDVTNIGISSLTEISKLMLESEDYDVYHIYSRNVPSSQLLSINENDEKVNRNSNDEDQFNLELSKICESEYGQKLLCIFYKKFCLNSFNDVKLSRILKLIISKISNCQNMFISVHHKLEWNLIFKNMFTDKQFLRSNKFMNDICTIKTLNQILKCEIIYVHNEFSKWIFTKEIQENIASQLFYIYESFAILLQKYCRTVKFQMQKNQQNREIVMFWENELLLESFEFICLLCQKFEECKNMFSLECCDSNLLLCIIKLIKVLSQNLNLHICNKLFNKLMNAIYFIIEGTTNKNKYILAYSEFMSLSDKLLKLKYFDSSDDNLESHQEENKNSHYLNIKYQNEIILPPLSNYQISLIKYHVSKILNELLSGDKAQFNSVVLRNISPNSLIKNLVYQYHFYKVFNQKNYTVDIFFRFIENDKDVPDSPIILETGFLIYFIIIKLKMSYEEGCIPHQEYSNLFSLISEKQVNYVTLNKSLLYEILDIFNDAYYIFKLLFIKRSKSISNIEVQNEWFYLHRN